MSVLFLFLLLINFLTPFMGEDYALISPNLLWQLNPVKAWNLRLGDTFTTLFLFGCQKIVFNFVNAAMAIAFAFLLFFWGKCRLPKKTSFSDLVVFLLGFALFYVCSANLGEIFFWCDGATNYLWTCVILFTLCAPYRKALTDDTYVFTKKWYLIVPYVIACFFAGWTNENSVPIMILLAGFILLKKLIKGGLKNLPIWLLTSVFLLGIGYAVLVFSPSTQNRSAFYRTFANLPKHMDLLELLKNAARVLGYFFYSNAVLLIVVILLLVTIKAWKIKSTKANAFMILLSLISIIVLFFNCYTENRSFLFVQFFVIAYVIGVFSKAIKELPTAKLRLIIPAVVMSILLVYSFISTYRTYSWYYEYDKARSADIRKQVADGKTIVEFTSTKHKDRYLNTREDYLIDEVGYVRYMWYHKVPEGMIFK